jgi:hypothetical protein
VSAPTGSKTINTRYHVSLIRKGEDGTIDALFSLSATVPIMPSGYINKKYIGSVKTNASGNIQAFLQHGNTVLRTDSTLTSDINGSTITTSMSTFVLPNIPNGLAVRVIGNFGILHNSARSIVSIHSPNTLDIDPDVNWPGTETRVQIVGILFMGSHIDVTTDTAAQICARSNISETILYFNAIVGII